VQHYYPVLSYRMYGRRAFANTPCLKKHPTFGLLYYNFDTREQILICFGRNTTDKVSNQKTLYYATSNNLCFCTIRYFAKRDFVISRFFMKLFETSDKNIVESCQAGEIRFYFAKYSIGQDKEKGEIYEHL